MQLVGPGALTTVTYGNDKVPFVYIGGTDPNTTVLVGQVIKGRKGDGVFYVHQVVHNNALTFRFSNGDQCAELRDGRLSR